MIPGSLSRVPEGQSLRLGSLNSKACPLPMVSYPRLISRFSSFMVLTASQGHPLAHFTPHARGGPIGLNRTLQIPRRLPLSKLITDNCEL
jgi:hypothetical protein